MAFRDYCSELVGTIPKLPYPLAQTLVNRAWKDIKDFRLWSWLIGFGDITAPALINAGTVSVTLGSVSVTVDGTAAAALNAVAVSNPVLMSPDLGVGRQIRLGNTGSAGPLYNIVAWDGATTLTLDRVYASATAAAQPYQVYKAYYAPPDTDFLRYLTITNMQSGYTIRGRKLYYNQQQLNSVDPQRGATGDAYITAAFRPDTQGRPVHEWYPHPVNLAVYNCIYQKRGVNLSDAVDLPATLPDTLLMARSAFHASQWAMANVTTYAELAQTNWVMFMQAKDALYRTTLLQCIKQDDEIFPLLPFPQGSQFDFPLGGQFMQNHDVSSLLGGI